MWRASPVTEVDVRRVDFEELPSLGFFSGCSPVRHHRVEQRCLDAAGHDRDEFNQTARIVVDATPARGPHWRRMGATSPWTETPTVR